MLTGKIKNKNSKIYTVKYKIYLFFCTVVEFRQKEKIIINLSKFYFLEKKRRMREINTIKIIGNIEIGLTKRGVTSSKPENVEATVEKNTLIVKYCNPVKEGPAKSSGNNNGRDAHINRYRPQIEVVQKTPKNIVININKNSGNVYGDDLYINGVRQVKSNLPYAEQNQRIINQVFDFKRKREDEEPADPKRPKESNSVWRPSQDTILSIETLELSLGAVVNLSNIDVKDNVDIKLTKNSRLNCSEMTFKNLKIHANESRAQGIQCKVTGKRSALAENNSSIKGFMPFRMK